MVEKIIIDGNPPIEAAFYHGREGAALIAHPHPLYGGNMDNNVVLVLEEAFRSCGFSTLRFNFRGVGRSGGSYSGGKGEVKDMELCYRFLLERIKDPERIVVSGYSFGAYVASLFAVHLKETPELVLISYPTAFYSWDHLKGYTGKKILISGEHDDIAEKDGIISLYQSLSPPKNLRFLNTDHFYWGHESELAKAVKEMVCRKDLP